MKIQLALCFSVLIGTFSMADCQTSDVLKQNYENNNARLPQLQLHLVFNQPKYYPGDTVWFKAYFSQ